MKGNFLQFTSNDPHHEYFLQPITPARVPLQSHYPESHSVFWLVQEATQARWLAELSWFLIGWAGNPGLWDSQHRRAAIPRTYHESNLAPTVNSGFKTKSHSNFGNPDTQSEVWKWEGVFTYYRLKYDIFCCLHLLGRVSKDFFEYFFTFPSERYHDLDFVNIPFLAAGIEPEFSYILFCFISFPINTFQN